VSCANTRVAVPRTPPDIEQPPAPDLAIFRSLEAFRGHCGEPSLPVERCRICSAIPDRCYRQSVSSLVSDYDVDYGGEGYTNTVPPQVSELEMLVNGPKLGSYEGEALLRCPTCHRLYHGKSEMEHVGARTYSTTSYQRVEVDTIYRSAWCVGWRLSDRDIAAVHPKSFLPRHALVRFPESPTWFLFDDQNQLAELAALDSESLQRAIRSDPPVGLDDPARAISYAGFLAELEDPDVAVIDSIDKIRWRDPAAPGDREQIEAARSASRVEAPAAERIDDHVVVRLWVVSRKRLILRVVTVQRSGTFLREDAVIAENLPV
jgi:hypothetical protein